MKTQSLFFLFFAFSWLSVFSQKNADIEGTLTDSTGTGLPFASIVVLQAQDSIIAGFGISEESGHFLIKKMPLGDYVLQASFVGYKSHRQAFSVLPDAGGQVNLGTIALQPANEMLDAVEIAAERVPMRFNSDTIEYNAAAFKTQPGAVVEDLLKKLPGVEVQRDGSIKAYGEPVQNVLVDGKEFFSNDPTLATKNLPADAVDKVQVFDKKSERAAFTGIDDGQEQKTINLSLKEDKKQGYFGNASAGGGTEGRYEGRFNLNRFSGKSQLSALGMANNTGQQGFSFNDYMQFMGGLSNLMSSSGGGGQRVSISLDPAEMGLPVGGGLGSGFITTGAGGLNFNQDFTAPEGQPWRKTKLNASYFYNRIQNDIDKESTRESLLNESVFASTGSEQRRSRNENHRLNATLRHELDSFQNLILRANASYNDAFIESNSASQTLGTGQMPGNSGTRELRTDGQNLKFNASLTYRRKFNRKGRSLVGDISFGQGNTDRLGRLSSINRYFLDEVLADSIRQRQQFGDEQAEYGGTLSYTEPVGKGLYAELSGAHQNFTNDTDKRFYDILPDRTELFNDDLSTRYRRGYVYDRGGLNLMLNRKKYNLTTGAALQRSTLAGKLPDENLSIDRSYTTVLPSLFFDYELATSRNFHFDYQTSLREPTIEQLQPVVDNTDPFDIYQGNPGLQPAYEHDLGLQFMNFDQFSFTSFFVNLGASYVTDRITNATSIDSLFRRTTHPVNVNDDLTLQGYLQFSTPIRPVKANVNLTLNSNWNKGTLVLNDLANGVQRWSNTLELSFDNRKKDLVDITVGARFTLNQTRYATDGQLDQAWLNQRYFTDLALTLKSWQVSSSFDYTVYSAERFGSATVLPIWKASIGHYFLKNNRGQLKLAVFDLLDRNVGIRRNSQLNYTEEERVRSLGRYAMLSFSYSLSGFGHKSSGIEIKMDERRD